MNFQPSADHEALLDATERIAQRHQAASDLGRSPVETSPGLDSDLDDAGLFDAAAIESLGAVAAVDMVMRLARLPQCIELVASALLLPLLELQLPRPCAMLWERRDRPARFLAGARAALFVTGNRVESVSLVAADTEVLASPFGYPVGRLLAVGSLGWQEMPGIDADALRRLWRLGIAAELAGVLGAGLDAVVAHVRDRRQFGRPLGTFQAVQHRLAEAAVRIEAMRWMALSAAASSSEADAAAAAGYAQAAAPTIVYDLHQFMGAMGLTLEHPLHRWTTRAKMLRADLGSAAAQHGALADAVWGPASNQRAIA